jgi:hypothetical protein
MTVTNMFNSESYFRSEYDSRWLSWAIEKYDFHFAEPSVTVRPPPLSLVPPTPLVPSTPLPEGLIFGSPAWQPGSRTPGRPLDEPEGPSDPPFVPLPPYRQIQKPRGKAGRSVGWLQQALEVDLGVFTQMRVSPNNRCHEFGFNITLDRSRRSGGATFRFKSPLHKTIEASA